MTKKTETQPDKATARRQHSSETCPILGQVAERIINETNRRGTLMERMKSLVNLYADSNAKPAAISFEYDELVQAVNEHDALEAVAEAMPSLLSAYFSAVKQLAGGALKDESIQTPEAIRARKVIANLAQTRQELK